MAVLASAGSVASAVYGGIPWVVGFSFGSAFSVLNFWVFHRVVTRVGQNGHDEKRSNTSAVLLGGRYLVLGAAGYAILNYFEASILAALAGCFIAVAAVLFEILYELASS